MQRILSFGVVGLSCLIAFIPGSGAWAQQAGPVLKQEPPPGSLQAGTVVYVDDGTCPPGSIEVTGGSNISSTGERVPGRPRRRRCMSSVARLVIPPVCQHPRSRACWADRGDSRQGDGDEDSHHQSPLTGCCKVQSPCPGLGEKYFSNFPGTPMNFLKSAAGSRLVVTFGQTAEYSAFSLSHRSRSGAVSGKIASTGHSGSQTLQSMHSSGWMTSMFSPS
jgi:hypothetical protein